MAERPKEVFFDTLCPDCQPQKDMNAPVEAPRSDNKLFVGHEQVGIVQPKVFPAQAPVHSPIPVQAGPPKTPKQKKKTTKQTKKETPGHEPVGSPIIDASGTSKNDREAVAPTLDQVESPVVEGPKTKEVEENTPALRQTESSTVKEAKSDIGTMEDIPLKKRQSKNESQLSTDSDWVKVLENHNEPWIFIDDPEDSSEKELLTTTGWPKQKPPGIKTWFRWK